MYLHNYLSIYLSIYTFTYLLTYISVYLPIYLSTYARGDIYLHVCWMYLLALRIYLKIHYISNMQKKKISKTSQYLTGNILRLRYEPNRLILSIGL
jgi:ABC-type Mn2+/Zn2+ transport system permease subunit